MKTFNVRNRLNELSKKIAELTALKSAGGVGYTLRQTFEVTTNSKTWDKDLIGVTVIDYSPERRKLVVPEKRPSESLYQGGIENSELGSLEMEYGTHDGALNKPCFMLAGDALPYCSAFIGCHETYDTLLYAYEDTSDGLGVGITFQKGWYALNKTNFVHEPIDINDYPVYIKSTWGWYRIEGMDDTFLRECFATGERETYTITEDKIANIDPTMCAVVNSKVPQSIHYQTAMFAANFGSLLYYADNNEVARSTSGTTTLSWEEIKPIDPQFLPNYTAPKKTVLYSGTPQKIDSGSMGILYVLSADNLLEVAEGQDIYGELVVGEATYSVVLDLYAEMPYFNFRIVSGKDCAIGEVLGTPTVAYIENLGGTGFGFLSGIGFDIGEISLTLWTEIGADKPYYITSLSLEDDTIPYINISNAKDAFRRDALYYRNNDDQVGKAVGFLPMTDGFNALFFIPMSSQAYLVQIMAGYDGVTESMRCVAMA